MVPTTNAPTILIFRLVLSWNTLSNLILPAKQKQYHGSYPYHRKMLLQPPSLRKLCTRSFDFYGQYLTPISWLSAPIGRQQTLHLQHHTKPSTRKRTTLESTILSTDVRMGSPCTGQLLCNRERHQCAGSRYLQRQEEKVFNNQRNRQTRNLYDM